MQISERLSIKEIAGVAGTTVTRMRRNEIHWGLRELRIEQNQRVILYPRQQVLRQLKQHGLLP